MDKQRKINEKVKNIGTIKIEVNSFIIFYSKEKGVHIIPLESDKE